MNGDTPLDFACENVIYNHEFLVNKEFAKLLIQHGGKTNNMKHKYNELLKILINEGEEVGLEHKIELISENNKKTKNKNKSGEGSCCTISTKSLEDEKIEGDNKEDSGNKIENKTIIIGKEKEKKDEDDKKDKNEIKPNICTKTVSF